MLKAKVDAGASRAITQFFFDNDLYFRYLDRVRARGITIPIVPGILPVQNFKQMRAFAERCGTSVPAWLADRFAGLDDDPATRRLIAAAVAAEQVLDLVDRGVTDFHFYTMNRADLVYAICHLLGVRSQPGRAGRVSADAASMIRPSAVEAELRRAPREAHPGARRRHGHGIQALKLDEAGYRGARFADWPSDLRGNNDILILSQPDAVRGIHLNYFRAGADIVCDQHLLLDPRSPRPITARRSSSPSSTSRRPPRPRGGRDRRTPKTAGRASLPAPSARPTAPPRSRPT